MVEIVVNYKILIYKKPKANNLYAMLDFHSCTNVNQYIIFKFRTFTEIISYALKCQTKRVNLSLPLLHLMA